jgi:hypothetical protein
LVGRHEEKAKTEGADLQGRIPGEARGRKSSDNDGETIM